MFAFLLEPIPLWATIISFLVGGLAGWLLRTTYDMSTKDKRSIFEKVIQITVFVLWTAATARAVFSDGVAYPPLFLNIIFGAIVGSMNKGVGEYILKAITGGKKK